MKIIIYNENNMQNLKFKSVETLGGYLKRSYYQIMN